MQCPQHLLMFVGFKYLKICAAHGPPELGAPCHSIIGVLVNPALVEVFHQSFPNLTGDVITCCFWWKSRIFIYSINKVMLQCDQVVDVQPKSTCHG